MSSSYGPLLVGAAVVVGIVGVIVWSGGLGWFGKLPGDIRFERGNTRVYVPLVSMLLISVVISLMSYLFRRRM